MEEKIKLFNILVTTFEFTIKHPAVSPLFDISFEAERDNMLFSNKIMAPIDP